MVLYALVILNPSLSIIYHILAVTLFIYHQNILAFLFNILIHIPFFIYYNPDFP